VVVIVAWALAVFGTELGHFRFTARSNGLVGTAGGISPLPRIRGAGLPHANPVDCQGCCHEAGCQRQLGLPGGQEGFRYGSIFRRLLDERVDIFDTRCVDAILVSDFDALETLAAFLGATPAFDAFDALDVFLALDAFGSLVVIMK